MSRHTKLFGSTSYRTLNCPAHYQRGADMPEPPTSAAAAEGTMLHGIAEEILKRPDVEPDDWPDFTALEDDQQWIVRTHVDTVRQLVGNGALAVEYRSESPHLHPEWFGTADAVIVKPPLLVIADLKCGRIGVEVEDDEGDINAQLASYAISVLESMPLDLRRQIRLVELVIVQPRSGGVKRRLVTLKELADMKRRLLEAAEDAESENPTARAGSWCKFCRANAVCETRREYIHEQAKLDFAAADGRPEKLTTSELHQILTVAGMARDWIEDVERYASSLLSAGGDIEGSWELVPRRAVRKWKDERVVKQRLLSEGIDPIEEKLISPAQAEKIAAKKGLTLDLSDLTTAESNGMKISRKVASNEYDDSGW